MEECRCVSKYDLNKEELSWMVPNVNMNGRSAFGVVILVPYCHHPAPNLRGIAFGFFFAHSRVHFLVGTHLLLLEFLKHP
jgi:hypothetical protein